MALPRLKVKRVLPRQETIVKEKTTVNVIEVPKEVSGPQGARGPSGERGLQGLPGPAPSHEIKGNSVRFQNPDGSWGKWLEFPQGNYFPGHAAVQYIPITSATYKVGADLIPGMNILGVNYIGDVIITLPQILDNNKLIVVKDEGGNASSHNITIIGE